MKKFLSLIVVLITLIAAPDALASHVAGGEIYYEYIGSPVNPYRYKVTLILIRDSRGIPAPNPVNINYTSSCFGGGSVTVSQDPSRSGQGLQSAAAAQGFPDPFRCVDISSSGLPANFGDIYQLYTYEAIITLPGKCNDWRFWYRIGNRNDAIANLVDPEFTYFYIDAILNNNFGPNSSPIFSDPPARSFCTNLTGGRPLKWSQKSNEIDGDSTYYSFGHPLDNYQVTIPFAPGYSLNQPIKTVNGITFLDRSTGVLSLQPNAPAQEDNVVKLDIEEFRLDTNSGFWISVGRVSREVTVPIISGCALSAQKGLSVNVSQPGFRNGAMSADSLYQVYGIDTTSINTIGNTPFTNANGELAYNIPVIDYQCFDSVINIVFDFPYECSSLTGDGSEFRLSAPDSSLRPIIGTYSKDCGYNGELEYGVDQEVSLLLHKKLDVDGYYVLQIRKGFDGNVLTNDCGFELPTGYVIIINVKNCPTIEYNMENVTVQGDSLVKMDWAVIQSNDPYLRPDLFESWDVRRVNNGTEYLIGRIFDMNARTFYDHTLKPEQLDYESFAYTVQLVQNKRYHLPANYISTILLKAAVGKVASRQYEMRLLWSPYNGFDTTAYYQLELAELNPDSSIISWSPYKNLAPNYQENTYLIDQSDVNNEGLFAFRVVASDEIAPFSPYISHSNYVYFQNKYEDIPDTTLVTVRAPNTFTPNEDGYNDRFFIEGINGNKEYREVSVTVYNRWGQKVFEDENFAARNNAIEGWDGTDMATGQKLSDGVYYYIVEMFDPGTQTKQDIKGSVTVLGGTE